MSAQKIKYWKYYTRNLKIINAFQDPKKTQDNSTKMMEKNRNTKIFISKMISQMQVEAICKIKTQTAQSAHKNNKERIQNITNIINFINSSNTR